MQKAANYGILCTMKIGGEGMKKFVAWLPALAWMGVIFMMSAMPGDISGEQSGLASSEHQ